MEILIATTNLGKFNIYKQIFDELNIKSISLRDVNIDIEVEETAETELENAVIKAMAYHKKTGMPVLCNDSGLIIDKLAKEDQPGVLVRISISSLGQFVRFIFPPAVTATISSIRQP